MDGTVTKRWYRYNRKKIFQIDDLVLWLGTEGRPTGSTYAAKLSLERRRTNRKSGFDVVWSGILSLESDGAKIRTTSRLRK